MKEKKIGVIAHVDHGISALSSAIVKHLEAEHEIIMLPIHDKPRVDVFLNEPIPITQLNRMEQIPKVNCKKGHNYIFQNHESTCGAVKELYKCRCGKTL
jgi:hypothetical protein